MKNSNKISALLLALILIFSLAIPSFAAFDHSEDFYVNDEASVLTSTTKNQIIEANASLESDCEGAQFVVVTIDYLPSGYDSEQYANLLFNNWGVGSVVNNNGILLLLVVEEYKGWLAVGAGIADDLTTSEINDMLDTYFWTYVDNNEFDAGVSSMLTQIVNFFEGYYGVSSSSSSGTSSLNDTLGGSFAMDGLDVLIVILLIIAVLAAGIWNGSRKGRRRGVAPRPVHRHVSRPPAGRQGGARPGGAGRMSGGGGHSGGGGGRSSGGSSGGSRSGGGGHSSGGGGGRR